MVCNFKLAANVVRGGVRKLTYDTNRPAILKRGLVGLYVDGNWWIWVQDCANETVSIYAVRERERERERERGGILQSKKPYIQYIGAGRLGFIDLQSAHVVMW